jgi:hypothetical protein
MVNMIGSEAAREKMNQARWERRSSRPACSAARSSTGV